MKEILNPTDFLEWVTSRDEYSDWNDFYDGMWVTVARMKLIGQAREWLTGF